MYSPTRAIGIAPKPIESYFGDDDGEDSFSFPTDRGYSAPVLNYQPESTLESVGHRLAAQDALNRLESLKTQQTAKREMMQPGIDWSTPENRAKLAGWTAQGAITPAAARAIDYSTRPPATNKYSPVPPEVARAAAQLNMIDPMDDNAAQQYREILGKIDPMVQTHPYLENRLRSISGAITQHRQHQQIVGHGSGDRREIDKALYSGIDADEVAPFLDENRQKIVNRAGFDKLVSQAARYKQLMTPDNRNDLATAQKQLAERMEREPTDEEKIAYLENAHPGQNWSAMAHAGQIPPAVWQEAYRGWKAEPQRKLQVLQSALQANGYRPLGGTAAPAPVAPPAQQAPALAPKVQSVLAKYGALQ